MNTNLTISHVGNMVTIAIGATGKSVHLDILNHKEELLVKFLMGLSTYTNLHEKLDGIVVVYVNEEIARMLLYVYYW